MEGMFKLASPIIRHIVEFYLGKRHELDTLTWVVAPHDAKRQAIHSDVEHYGSLACFFPLQSVDKDFSPIVFYPETQRLGLFRQL